MKRLIALICLASALLAPLQTTITANAAGYDAAAIVQEEQKAGTEDALPALTKNEMELQSESLRLAAIASIRAKYENSEEIVMLAKLIYREAGCVKSDTEKAAVVWCVLNRVDDARHPNTIKKVITQKHQFAWKKKTPVLQKFKDLALDVVIRWELEKKGFQNVGRILPSNYLFFAGRKGHNWFRNKFKCKQYWDWSIESPYNNGILLSVMTLPTVTSVTAGAQ